MPARGEYKTFCKRGHDRRQTRLAGGGCRECVQERIVKAKTLVREAKKKGCSRCGYDRCLGALQFHHRTTDKRFEIARGYSQSIQAVERELAKCDLLCANCHAEMHDREGWLPGDRKATVIAPNCAETGAAL